MPMKLCDWSTRLKAGNKFKVCDHKFNTDSIDSSIKSAGITPNRGNRVIKLVLYIASVIQQRSYPPELTTSVGKTPKSPSRDESVSRRALWRR